MRCAYARLPRRGNPWAHKALFGAGRIAQSPKPPIPPPPSGDTELLSKALALDAKKSR